MTLFALSCLHELDFQDQNYLYLKPLEMTEGLLQVADFNLSRALKDEMVPHSDPVNSAEWAAPEKLDGKKPYNGRAADVFRFK